MISRRVFLRQGGFAVAGTAAMPLFLPRISLAASPTKSRKTLVVVFQRGGVDGLSMAVPFGDPFYYKHRSSITIAQPTKEKPSALDLNGFFGLNPSMEPLLPLYSKGELAIVHAVGNPKATRSHFDAQKFMECGVGDADKRIGEGWLNRYVKNNPDPSATTFRSVSLGNVLPRTMQGPAPALAMGNLTGTKLSLEGRSLYASMYAGDSDDLLSGTSSELFAAMDTLEEVKPFEIPSTVDYGPQFGPYRGFTTGLQRIAQLIKADLGVEVAFVDIGGWDTHAGQGGAEGGLAFRLGRFSQALAAFHQDLGDRMEDVLVLTMSEFGRTTRENGNGGTDHGYANVMLALGGGVKGGAVYGEWPGLAPEQLNENRDLALTTDYRDVFAEILVKHLGCANPDSVFPNHTVDPERFLGLVRA